MATLKVLVIYAYFNVIRTILNLLFFVLNPTDLHIAYST